MELIKWDDKFATGISGIDAEHEELIYMINSFYSKQTKHTSKDELIQILNNIFSAIHAHFMLEERLMLKHVYDEYEAHREDHARLLDDIRDITIELEKTSDFDEQLLKQKLNDWFLIHFKTFDSRLHKLEHLITTQENVDSGLIAGLKKLKSMFSGKY